MNLFWKILFGSLTGTTKLEKKEILLQRAMQRYERIGKSLELTEYKDLKQIVKSAGFQEKKETLLNRKYKDTEEYRNLKKFNKIISKKSFKLYLEVSKSGELANFLEFQKTDQYNLLSDRKAVKNSELLQQMRKYEHSKAYKIYMRYHNSFIEKEYLALQEQVSAPDFEQRNAFWANPKRWETTEEYKMDMRYQQLKKNPDIIFYNKTNPTRFEPFSHFERSFEDMFNGNSLLMSRWNFGFYYKNPKLIRNHSFANEKQANNAGNNVSVSNGYLTLHTKKEHVLASAWNVKKGFVEQEFEYTSDVMQTAETFRQTYGLFRAKLRCKGKLHHAFWLGGDEKLPLINIFHFDGKHVTVGNATARLFDQAVVTGINPSKFYIYSLLWTPKELVWYINNVEVFRTAANVPTEQLYLAFNSFISEKQKGTTGVLEVDWVRVYSVKQ